MVRPLIGLFGVRSFLREHVARDTKKFTDFCNIPQEKGHYKIDCPEEDEANVAMDASDEEVLLTAIDLRELKDATFGMESRPKERIFLIADSGASVHLTGSLF